MTVKSHNIENTDQSVMIHIVPQTGQSFADHDGGPPPIKVGIPLSLGEEECLNF